jgi:hypothetical protein
MLRRQVHLLNALKYLSSILTTFLNLIATTYQSAGLLVLWALCAFGSSGFSFWWDIRKDWGLLDPESKVWLLRKNIVFPPVVYYIAVLVNVRCYAYVDFNCVAVALYDVIVVVVVVYIQS